MAPLLVDSHCHLDLLDLDACGGDLEAVMATAVNNGVGHILCAAVNLTDLPQIMALATRDARIFASVGIHPNEKLAEEPSEAEIVSLASHPRVVAIGETGLDYYRDHNTSESQQERFRRHISAARSVKKPLIIHCREAREDTINILKEEGADAVGGVMHCFADDWETALKALELNFLISFSGIVT
ncbi:MAG: TatD family hydrolase, partial [Gammaproteobacteria bacterium]|nr:TatD family hydrolase [Gammaproteobacteria bacterium]